VYRLVALEVHGYRAFANWSRLELRPLTLVYGRNNAGKSSMLRLLALLADSVEDGAQSAIECGGPAGRGASFRGLPWQGDGTPRASFRFRLHWSRDNTAAQTDEFVVVWSDEENIAYVRELDIHDAKGSHLFSARAQATPSDPYLVGPDFGANMAIRWTGLLPDGAHPELEHLRERLQALRRSVIWLDSNRPRPLRLTPAQGASPPRLDHDGKNALEFLAADRDLQNKVEKWFIAPPIERAFRLQQLGEYVQPKLRSKNGVTEFHLFDTGEGMTQVLPVLVAAQLGAQRHGHRVVAVEEPESHLHGDAQRALILHLATLAAQDDPPVFLLETHSREVLLSLQLAVAQAVIPPQRCGVVWCEQRESGVSTLAQIQLTRAGELRGWPRMALGEESALVRELLDLQDALRQDGAA